MSLFLRFKKDYFNYLISIILPALITGISIPVFKHLLGAEGYGNFSIYLNAVLICTAIATGWTTQSTYRFYTAAANKEAFAKFAINISLTTQLIIFSPIFLIAWHIKGDIVFAVLICLAVFITSMQSSFMAIAQSSFLSKKSIYSESIRSVSYILVAVTFLLFTTNSYLYSLFIAVVFSYTLSVIYLRRQTHLFFLQTKCNTERMDSYGKLFKQFLRYGAPLSLWFVFAYLLSYVDKIFMLNYEGARAQGNYQAIFDLLSRGITLIIYPVVISLLPLLTSAFAKGQTLEIKKLLQKIIWFEIGGYILSVILYWWFGATIMLKLLNTPDNITYRLMGFIVITGTFVWQIAVVVQKQYELRLRSLILLFMVTLAFLFQLIFYWIFRKSGGLLLYPMGYLLSAITYLILVSLAQLTTIFKSLIVAFKKGLLR